MARRKKKESNPIFDELRNAIEKKLEEENDDWFSGISKNRDTIQKFVAVASFGISFCFVSFVLVAVFGGQEYLINFGLLGDFFGFFSAFIAVFALVIVMTEVRINSQLMIINSYLRIIDSEKDREHAQDIAIFSKSRL